MNFIGHATVALWQPEASAPEFVLGSMLPDFAGMARTRLRAGLSSAGLPAREDERASADARGFAMRAGIALHHRTDDVFHGQPIFVRLLQQTLDELSAQGVARGTARAVGHVGVEMFIDGELLREADAASAYLRALNAGGDFAALFVDAEGAARWELLRQRLIVYGAPYDYREPEAVLTRLQLMLRGRPRLAIDNAALPILRQSLPGLQRKVVAQLPALLTALQRELTS